MKMYSLNDLYIMLYSLDDVAKYVCVCDLSLFEWNITVCTETQPPLMVQ